MFDFGEGLFDGIEVGRIGRQEPQTRARGADGLFNGRAFVASQIIHDDDLARLEGWYQKLIYPRFEAGSVYRTIEDAWRLKVLDAQGSYKGHGSPMTIGRVADEALASLSPAS